MRVLAPFRHWTIHDGNSQTPFVIVIDDDESVGQPISTAASKDGSVVRCPAWPGAVAG